MRAPIDFDNTYARELDGFFAPQQAVRVEEPELLLFNHELARDLGLAVDDLDEATLAAFFSGAVSPPGAEPIAQAYAGHQFGGFSPQLGDGRALLLGEVLDPNGARWDIQLKGSGPTPFSRGGDGKAPLGPVLREYLMAEAMHALGVPTTRALAAVATNTPVYRDEVLPGAVLTRVAASHVRIGTFQFFAARSETEKVQQLADYVIARHYPELSGEEGRYLRLVDAVAGRQAALVAHWMSIGFIHGVMNTDNMAIAGETIDYGPCAFMDHYDPATVYSSIDRMGRYAYGNQPGIAQWNLARFAETLLPLLHAEEKQAVELATEAVVRFPTTYQDAWLSRFRSKLGLMTVDSQDEGLIQGLLTALEANTVDFTRLFRALGDVVADDDAVSGGSVNGPAVNGPALKGGAVAAAVAMCDQPTAFEQWLQTWQERLRSEDVDPQERAARMRATNPVYIPRNHLVEAALQQSVGESDLTLFHRLREVLASPFEEREGLEEYAKGADPGAVYSTFCGT